MPPGHQMLLQALSRARTASPLIHIVKAYMASKPRGKVLLLNDTTSSKKLYSHPKSRNSGANTRSSLLSRTSERNTKPTEHPTQPEVHPELQALSDRIDVVEQAIFSGKRVKCEYIDKLMYDCIRKRQYHLVSNCFVLFDEAYYLVDEEDGDAAADDSQQAIVIRPPKPSYRSYITALYAAAVVGNTDLAQSILLLLLGENFDIAASSADIQWICDLDPYVWQDLHDSGLVHLSEALGLDSRPAYVAAGTLHYLATGEESRKNQVSTSESNVGHVPSLLTLLACMMASDSKSAALAVTSLPTALLAEASHLYLPLIVHGLYKSNRPDAVAGFLHAAAEAGAKLSRPLLDSLIKVASAHEHRLHVISYFDSYFAGAITANDVVLSTNAPHTSLHALSYTLGKAKPVSALLWQRQEAIMDATDDPAQQLWLQLQCGDAGMDVAGEEFGWFSITGAHLLPLLHAYACKALTERVPAPASHSALFPPGRAAVTDALQALRGLPGPYWYAVQRASPVLWRETVVLAEVAAQFGYNDKYTRSVAIQSCMNARKPVQVLYLCERMLMANVPVRIRLASDVCAFLGKFHVPALPLSVAAVTRSADVDKAIAMAYQATEDMRGILLMRGSGEMAWELCIRALKEPISEHLHLTRMRLGVDTTYYANNFSTSGPSALTHAQTQEQAYGHTQSRAGGEEEAEVDNEQSLKRRKITATGVEGLIDALLLSGQVMRVTALLCVMAGINVKKTFSSAVVAAIEEEMKSERFWPLALELRGACLSGLRSAGTQIVRGPTDTVALLRDGEKGLDRVWSPEFAVLASTHAAPTANNTTTASGRATATHCASTITGVPSSGTSSSGTLTVISGIDLVDFSFFSMAADVATTSDSAALHPHIEELPADWLKAVWGRTVLVLATHAPYSSTSTSTAAMQRGEAKDANATADANFNATAGVNDGFPPEDSCVASAPLDPLLHARAAVEMWAAAQLSPLPTLHTATAHTAVLSALARVRACTTLHTNLVTLLAPTEERVAAFIGDKYGDVGNYSYSGIKAKSADTESKGTSSASTSTSSDARDAHDAHTDSSTDTRSTGMRSRPKRRRNKPKLSLEFVHNASKDRRANRHVSTDSAWQDTLTSVGNGVLGIREQLQHVYARVVDALHVSDAPRAMVKAMYELAARRFHWPLLKQLPSDVTAGVGGEVHTSPLAQVDLAQLVRMPYHVPLSPCEPAPLPLALLREVAWDVRGVPMLDVRRAPVSFAQCAVELAVSDRTETRKSEVEDVVAMALQPVAQHHVDALVVLVEKEARLKHMPLLSGTCGEHDVRRICEDVGFMCDELWQESGVVVLLAKRQPQMK